MTSDRSGERRAADSTAVRVAVGLGSNAGDREENLRFAVRELERRLRRVRLSSVYRSEPREGARGGPFLNMCVAGEWTADPGAEGDPTAGLDPSEEAAGLLRELRFVELGAGRALERGRGEPRTLDLDLLLFGGYTVRRPGLEVPHPRMTERAFVLRPLAELMPERVPPGETATVAELAGRVEDDGLVRYRPEDDIHRGRA